MKKFLVLLICFLPIGAIAQVADLGSLSQGLVEGPVALVTQFLYGVSYITGMFFLFKAYENFKGHRARPETIPIVGVYFSVAFGITLLLLPLSHHLVDKFY